MGPRRLLNFQPLTLKQLTLTAKDIAPMFWGFEIGDNNERPKCIDQEPTGWLGRQFW
jgi:hypothetical protein